MRLLILVMFSLPLLSFAKSTAEYEKTEQEQRASETFSDREIYVQTKLGDPEFIKLILLHKVNEESEQFYNENKDHNGNVFVNIGTQNDEIRVPVSKDVFIKQNYSNLEDRLDGFEVGNSDFGRLVKTSLALFGGIHGKVMASALSFVDEIDGKIPSELSADVIDQGVEMLESLELKDGNSLLKARTNKHFGDLSIAQIKNKTEVKVFRSELQGLKNEVTLEELKFE